MGGISDRRILLKDIIAYHDGKDIHTFNIEFTGSLSNEPRGKTGPASDRMVILSDSGKTIAESRESGEISQSKTKEMWTKFAVFAGSVATNVCAEL
jgi:inosine/xanthosine triphosphate pyrophosphatase family protein